MKDVNYFLLVTYLQLGVTGIYILFKKQTIQNSSHMENES